MSKLAIRLLGTSFILLAILMLALFDNAVVASSPIEQKYRTLINGGQRLGSPAGEEQAAPDRRGRYRNYQNGVIYYTPQTGAHYLRGAIAERWHSLGAERSELGYPTTDETIWPDGRRVVCFEQGAIFWDGQDEPLIEIHAR